MPVIPSEALKEVVLIADKVLAGSTNVSTMVVIAPVTWAMTTQVKASEQVVQDFESENIPLKEWMSKTNVKMTGKKI